MLCKFTKTYLAQILYCLWIDLYYYLFYWDMNDTGNSFGSNPASLKGKLQTLEVLMFGVSNKSRTFLMSSIITKRKCRFSEARRTPSSQSSL